MQRIYEPQDLMEGELLLGMLASEGIEAYHRAASGWRSG
jgi:hypothetical protein